MKKFVLFFFGCSLLFLGNSCVVRSKPTTARTITIKQAPRNHKVVVIKGKKYYTWGGKNYKKTRRGYVIVNR
jgi:hypothetical protein